MNGPAKELAARLQKALCTHRGLECDSCGTDIDILMPIIIDALNEAERAGREGMLTFESLRMANLSRCSRWHPRGLGEWSLSDWGVATAGEMGEALNIIKKLNRERDGIAGNVLDVDQLRKELADELADVAIYLDLLAASEKIDLAEAIVNKFNRTSVKVGFPERLELSIRALPVTLPGDTNGTL